MTVAVEATPIYDATNGFSAVAKCGVDAICSVKKGTSKTTWTLQMFDAKRPITINLRTPERRKNRPRALSCPTTNGSERQRRRQGAGEAVGARRSETTVANSEDVDAALLATIRTAPDRNSILSRPSKVIEQLSLARWTTSFQRATRSA